jgi:CBS domain-containing protein
MGATVRQVLQAKGDAIWSVSPKASVFDALTLMADKDIGAVVVLDGERLVGILSERDYARRVILQGRTSKDTTIGELMTRDVWCVHPDQTVDECMALMTDKHIRHLPVIENGALVGLITIGDAIKRFIDDQEVVIHKLESYILAE